MVVNHSQPRLASGTMFFKAVERGYASLADAYNRAGQKALAIENFKKALQMDPQNYFAIDQLKALN